MEAPPVPELAVMGIGSWPRPRWMIEAMHAHVEGRLSEKAFHETADDAVRLAIAAQEKAGVDVVTDGEQRRDRERYRTWAKRAGRDGEDACPYTSICAGAAPMTPLRRPGARARRSSSAW